MIDIPEVRQYCNAYRESHIKGLLSVALDELEAARKRIVELENINLKLHQYNQFLITNVIVPQEGYLAAIEGPCPE
jgi:hypothetical protein